MNNELNISQQLAVEHYRGPSMVIAPPGSGKTYVITKRVQYLIEHYNVDPMGILVITYTKAAAMEMQQRFFQVMQNENFNSMVTFGTFHSVFFQILQHTFQFRWDNIIHEYEKHQYMRELYETLPHQLQEDFLLTREFIEILLSEISKVKNNNLNRETYRVKTISADLFWEIYEGYTQKLNLARKIDFDDMILKTYELLKSRVDVLEFWQTRFEFILIDEMQDANYLQFEIIKMLALSRNVFAVGDDDQSIYGFRGGKPDIMLKFHEHYSEMRQIQLTTNYRSNQQIVDIANQIIRHNKNRFEKKVMALETLEDAIKSAEYESTVDEYEQICVEIKKITLVNRMKESMNKENIAVLFRTKVEMSGMAEFLHKNGIDFFAREEIHNLYGSPFARDIINYMEFAHDRSRRDLFLEIMNKPNRLISRSKITGDFSIQNVKRRYCDNTKILNSLLQMEFDLNKIRDMEPYAGIIYICKKIGYETYYLDNKKHTINSGYDHSSEETSAKEMMEKLLESAKNFSTYRNWKDYIQEYEKLLNQLKKSPKQNSREAIVTLSTIHGAKGLEYHHVFLPSLNHGIIPHKKAMLPSEIEEERRIFYVALTRAKKYLYLSYVKGNKENPQKPSGFWGELFIGKEDYSSSSTISSNSELSKYSSNASATASYSSSSSINSNVGSAFGSDSSSE